MNVVLAILLVILTVAAAYSALISWDKGDTGSTVLRSGITLLLILALIVLPFSMYTVKTGEVAVVRHFGKITNVREPGMHFDFWLTNSHTKYDTKVQDLEIQTAAYSSDAQTMEVTMTIQYQILADQVVNIATQYGTLGNLENRMSSISVEKTKAVLSSYKAMDIIANRAQISPEVELAIKEAIGAEYYVDVTAVVLTNIDFSDAFEQAVEEKMIAEQSKLRADYENQTKVAKAEAEAQAELKAAQAKVDIAKAEAEALQISAEAEAKANQTVAKSLTDAVLEKYFLDAWNGQLPAVLGSDGKYILPDSVLE